MAFPALQTERLRLIEIEEKHVNSYFAIMSRDDVTQFYGMESLNTQDEALQIIESFHNGLEAKRSMRWGIEHKETGEFIGTVGLNNLKIEGRKAEVGYELHPSHWGNGLTTEAVKEVLNYCFDVLDLYRVGAVTYPQNIASTSLLEKLGFVKEGLLRGYLYQNKQNHDATVFSLLRSDWVKA